MGCITHEGMQNVAINVNITSCNTYLVFLGPGHLGLDLLDPVDTIDKVSECCGRSSEKY